MVSGSVLYDVAFINPVAQGHRVYIKLFLKGNTHESLRLFQPASQML